MTIKQPANTPEPTPNEPDRQSGPIRRYDAQRMFVDTVLDAIDEAADEIMNSGQPHFVRGWEDADLENLLYVLEDHFKVLWTRHHPLEAQSDEPTPHP